MSTRGADGRGGVIVIEFPLFERQTLWAVPRGYRIPKRQGS